MTPRHGWNGRLILAAILTFFLLTACRQCWLPAPTAKTITPSAVAGLWVQTVTSGADSYTVQIELKADGTYDQALFLDGDTQPMNRAGRWQTDGGQVVLTDLMTESISETAPWETRSVTWWFIDGFGDDQPFILFGGLNGDPDTWGPFLKMR